jgi:4-hydroxybenzoyl-CoA thioesterase
MGVDRGHGPFRYTLRVRFDDVDHVGIVYYPRFFHYFHLAFEELFIARLGGGAAAYRDLIENRHVGFPAVHSEADFKSPLRFGDMVEIELTAPHVGQKSITFHYTASKVDGNEHTLAAEGRVTTAVLDMQTFRSMTLPDDLRPMFEGLR